ncbi:MAG: dipeptidase [Clostridiales bacterium]|nr:dipeptidase [Clostridiales bacterium]
MKNRIEGCRQAALDILKPSRKQFEYALDLHRDALVWDAYGFSPSGISDYSRIEKMKNENASADELTIAKEEEGALKCLFSNEVARIYREIWDASGVDCIFQNAGEEGNSVERMILRLARFTAVTDTQKDLYMRAVFPRDVEKAKTLNKKSLFMTTNGIPLPVSFRNENDLLFYIHVFFEFGVRMMHLTYNRRNLIGDGCAEKSDAGLSDFGKKVIAEMNRVGVIPDVAHCGQRTSLEAAIESKLPVVASHSVCHSLVDHCRAKKDEVIKAIAKSGGYVGIVILNDMLGGTGDINALLNHIDYVAENFGTDYIAIGSDACFNMVKTKPLQIIKRKNYESFWPAEWGKYRVKIDPDYNSLAWTNWPIFTLGMHMRGYSDEDIRKILGLNIMRVCKQTMSASEYVTMIRE